MPKTYTAAGSAVAGDVYTAAAHNVIVTDVNNFIVPPMVRATRTNNLTGYTSNTDISWESVSSNGGFDTDGMWSVSNPARITFNTAGVYLVTFNWILTFTGTITVAEAYIFSSASNILVDDYKNGSYTNFYQGSLSTLHSVSAADYVTARIAITGGSSYGFTAERRLALQAVFVGKTS